MDNEKENYNEDKLIDFDFDDEDKEELLDSKFIAEAPVETKFKKTKEEKISQFYDKNKKMLAEKIIETKTGDIIEIKYRESGIKESYVKKDKKKRIKKAIDYYENGVKRLSTDYEANGSYKSSLYEPDGTLKSFVNKHADGTSDSIYYNIDNKGTKLLVKMDANKEVIEKKVVRD